MWCDMYITYDIASHQHTEHQGIRIVEQIFVILQKAIKKPTYWVYIVQHRFTALGERTLPALVGRTSLSLGERLSCMSIQDRDNDDNRRSIPISPSWRDEKYCFYRPNI